MRTFRHNRLTRFVFRTGMIVCGLIVIVWAASVWRSLNVAVPGWRFTANYGSVWLFRDGVAMPGVWTEPTMQGFVPWAARRVGGPLVAPVWAYKLWLVLFVAMIPTIIAWRLRPELPPGLCQKCGYNLKGNTSGTCPECGRKIDVQPLGTNTGVAQEGSKDDFKAIP